MLHRAASLLAAATLLLACNPSVAPRLRDSGGPPPGSDAGTTPPPDYDAGPYVPPPDAGPPLAGDRDNDGIPDADEATHGTDPDNADTDGDGVDDGVEVLAGTDPTDAASTIPPTDFYVVLPYEDPAVLRELDFTARLGRADIFFLVDTTGSMGAAIGSVRDSLSSTIVPAINDAIADAVMGVGDYRDFPIDPYGSPGDYAFNLGQAMTSDVARVQGAVNALSLGNGNDGPESMVEAVHRTVAGTCADGSGFGQACFRAMSHPIVVLVTDAPSHNGPGGSNAYSGVTPTPRTYSEAVSALTANEVKIVGGSVDAGLPFPFPIPGGGGGRAHLESFARDTDSRALDGSLTVYDSPGGEVSTSVVDGILDLVSSTEQDVTSRQIDDTTDSVDATMFMKAIRPVRASRATTFDDTTFFGVGGGTTITFEVHFENDFLPAGPRVQIFQAFIEVVDVASGTALDRRNVYIVVPAVGGVLI